MSFRELVLQVVTQDDPPNDFELQCQACGVDPNDFIEIVGNPWQMNATAMVARCKFVRRGAKPV